MLSKEEIAKAITEIIIKGIQNPEVFPVELNVDDDLRDNLFRIIHEFIKDSTRARPIFLADVLDKKLAHIIREYLFDDNTKGIKSDSLLGDCKPIHPFAHRITLAYRLRLLPKGTMDELKLIKKIRNEFAHNWLVDHFDTDATQYLNSSKLYPVAKGVFSNSIWARNGINEKDMHITVSEISFLFYTLYIYIILVVIEQQHYCLQAINLKQLFQELANLIDS